MQRSGFSAIHRTIPLVIRDIPLVIREIIEEMPPVFEGHSTDTLDHTKGQKPAMIRIFMHVCSELQSRE